MFVSSFPYRGALSWPLRAVRLAGLAVLVVTVAHEAPLTGARLALLVAASTGWFVWLASDWLGPRGQAAALLLIGVPGGLLAGLADGGVAVAFPAVALVDMGARLRHGWTAGLTAVVLAATAAGHAGTGWHAFPLHAVLLAACALAGTFRWEYLRRAEQSELLLTNIEVAAQEHARAAALAERSRIARELHDIQAHALSALSVQLKVIDALVEDGAEPERVRTDLARAGELAREGLTETRRAILALRDETLPLENLLKDLAQAYTADLEISGTPAKLPTDVTMALYRAAQEALTNARRHAPRAPVEIELRYEPDATSLTLANGLPEGAVPTRPGYGTAGIFERAELLGGTASAGPDDGRWLVCVRIPA